MSQQNLTSVPSPEKGPARNQTAAQPHRVNGGAGGVDPDCAAFRLYAPEECTGRDDYPEAWHETLKHQVRVVAGYRCVRCHHPYRKGDGEWSRCNDACRHGGPVRYWTPTTGWGEYDGPDETIAQHVEARYRILTVHHLDGNKGNCRWWNLVALCQRCHLTIQGKVRMDRRWPHEHSDWFKPYVAGYYAHVYLGEDISREEAGARMGELLALEVRQMELT